MPIGVRASLSLHARSVTDARATPELWRRAPPFLTHAAPPRCAPYRAGLREGRSSSLAHCPEGLLRRMPRLSGCLITYALRSVYASSGPWDVMRMQVSRKKMLLEHLVVHKMGKGGGAAAGAAAAGAAGNDLKQSELDDILRYGAMVSNCGHRV